MRSEAHFDNALKQYALCTYFSSSVHKQDDRQIDVLDMCRYSVMRYIKIMNMHDIGIAGTSKYTE